MKMTSARGCGVRSAGGCYAICETSADGLPIEHFLIDSPLLLAPGLQPHDLVNKPQLWQHPDSGIYHLLIWVGAEHYPYVTDFIEEVRRLGASRKISPLLEVDKLSPGKSQMLLAHPRCRLETWQDQALPRRCVKRGCDCLLCRARVADKHHDRLESDTAPTPPGGPCLGMAYDLLPVEAGVPLALGGVVMLATPTLYERTIASTTYVYEPTGASAKGLAPGLFAALPLHGFDCISDADGALDARQQAFRSRIGAGFQNNVEDS